MANKYECQDMFSHEVIAMFDTYDEADKFIDKRRRRNETRD